MPLPFLLESAVDAVRLFELPDGRFQLIEQGPIGPVHAGFTYLVLENDLAEWLRNLGIERVRFEPVVLFDRGEQLEYSTHTRLRVGQFFRPSEIGDLALDGLRLLAMNDEYYFVSPELKSMLETSKFTYLRFSEGLAGFAASDA